MEDILIECSPGISGDMLLGAFYDLGVPKKVIEKPLSDLGLKDLYHLEFKESKSCSIRGIKAKVVNIDGSSIKRTWRSIKELISNGKLEDKLKQIIYEVFESLASAEGKVHGINSEFLYKIRYIFGCLVINPCFLNRYLFTLWTNFFIIAKRRILK